MIMKIVWWILLKKLKVLVFLSMVNKRVIANSDEFHKIKNNLLLIFSNSRLMPAFGVSLHKETLNELKSGAWLQINFSQPQTKNGLPFNALLFKLEETKGFNLIRLFDGKYEGRCLFLDLDQQTNLKDIVEIL